MSRILSSYGARTFAAAGPRLWNSLPVQLRNSDIIYGLFRRQLNGHLLREARTQRSVTSDMRRHGKTLTYLLTSICCGFAVYAELNLSCCTFVAYCISPCRQPSLWSRYVAQQIEVTEFGPTAVKKGKGSPYSTAERRVPELIPVLGSQPAGDVSHKPGGRLPLLSARSAVTNATLKRAATNFAAW